MFDLQTIVQLNRPFPRKGGLGPQERRILDHAVDAHIAKHCPNGAVAKRLALKSLNRRAALLAAAAGGASRPEDVATALSILKSTLNPAVSR